MSIEGVVQREERERKPEGSAPKGGKSLSPKRVSISSRGRLSKLPPNIFWDDE